MMSTIQRNSIVNLIFIFSFFFLKNSGAQCVDSTMVIISQNQKNSGPMEFQNMQVLHFNQFEKKTEEIQYYWLGTNWQPSSKDTLTYLFDTLVESHESFQWANNLWFPVNRESWQYVNGALPNGYLLQHWTGSSWVDSLRTVYTYDGSFNILERVNQFYSGNQWIDKDRISVLRYGLGSVVDSSYEVYNNGLVYYGKRTINYFDGIDDTLILTKSKSNNDTTWYNDTYNRLVYDNLHRVILLERSFWNGTQWVNSAQDIIHYVGTTNRRDSVYTNSWNVSTSNWDQGTLSTSLYDVNDHLINNTRFHWNGFFWIESDRDIYTYSGSLLAYSSSDYFFEGFWHFWYYTNYHYDVHGHLVGANGDSEGAHSHGGSYFQFDANGIYISYSGWSENKYVGEYHSFLQNIYYGTINGNSVFCNNGSTTLSVDGCPGSTYNWSTGETTPTITVTNTDSITVQVIYPNGYQTYIAPIFVEAQSPIIFSSATDSVEYRCGQSTPNLIYPGQAYLLYQWYKNDSLIPGMTTSRFQSDYWSTHPTEGDYYLVATNSCGSDTSVTTTIVDVSLPNDSISIIGSVPFCTGDTVMLIAKPGYSYLWYPGYTTAQSITVYSGGYYLVKITDSTNCFTTKSINLTSYGPPGTPVIYRDGPEIILNDSTGGQWFKDGNLIQGNYLHFIPSQSGYYHVELTNSHGCFSKSDSIYFDMNALFAQAGRDKSTCSGNAVLLGGNYTAFGGIPPYHFQWSPSIGLISDTLSNPLCVTDSIRNYIVVITDSTGNVATDTIHVQAYPVYIPIISHLAVPVCSGTYLTLTASPSAQGNYRWTRNSSFYSSGTYNQINAYSDGVYQVTLTNGYGCIGVSLPDTITFYPPISRPSLQPAGVFPLCYGDSILLHYTPDSTLSYSWSLNNTSVQPLNDSSLYASQPGNFTVIATSINGCTAVSSVQVNIDSVLDVSIFPSSLVYSCPEDSLMAITLDYPGYSYQWKNNTVDLIGETTRELFVSSTGTYQVEVTSPAGCSGLSPVLQAVVYPPMTGTIVSRNDTVFLESNAADFQNYVTYWYDGVTQNYLSTGNYIVSNSNQFLSAYISNSNTGCHLYLQYEYRPCSLSIVNSVSPPCLHDSTGMIELLPFGNSPFLVQWSDGDTSLIRTQLPVGIYNVQITDSNGCIGFLSDTLNSISNIKIDSIKAIVNCSGLCDDSLLVLHSGEVGPVSFNWNTGEQFSFLNNACTGIYIISIVDSLGCAIADSINYIEPSVLSASSVVTNTSCAGCSNGNIQLAITSGNFPYYYSWQPAVGLLNGNSIVNLPAGIYNIRILDGSGCEINLTDTILDDPLGIGLAFNENLDYFFYPNPFESYTTLNSPKQKSNEKRMLIVKDNLNRTVHEMEINSERVVLNKGELNSGLYIYLLVESNQVIAKGKLVIE